MLTIVAAMGYGRPIFVSPPDRRDEANAAKQRLTSESAAAKSDHLTLIAAFNTWKPARLKGGRSEPSSVRFTFDAHPPPPNPCPQPPNPTT